MFPHAGGMAVNPDSKIDLISMIQQFTAVDSVGVSAMRNQGPGVLKAVQRYLSPLQLDDIPVKSENEFGVWLAGQTEGLLRAMPLDTRPWGTARKALNLFLRGCLYNHYLRRHYRLDHIEHWLEIPLDSVTAKALKREAGRGQLPQWPGLKHLRKQTSDKFQAYARTYSESVGLPARIFVDNYLWLKNR